MTKEINIIVGGFDDGRTPSVQQYDMNSRKFFCKLWEKPGVPYEMAENAIVGVVYKWRKAKPTGEYETEIIDKSTVLVNVPGAATQIEGPVVMQLVFHQRGGELRSPEITFMVLESLTAGTGEADEPKLLLEELIEEAKEAVKGAEEAANNASKAAAAIENITASATGLETGAEATATVTEVGGVKHFFFGLPRGEKGEKGEKGDPGTIENMTITSINGLPEALANVDAKKLGGKAPQYYLPAVNLLVNSDFRRPIGHAGIGDGVYHGAEIYPADKWREWTPGTTHHFDPITGLTTSENCTFAQVVDVQLNKPYTIALGFSDGTVLAANGVLSAESPVSISDSKGIVSLYVVGGVTYFAIGFCTNCIWAVLCEGAYTVETLPPYVSTHPRVEMLKVGNPVHPRNLLDNSWWKQLNEIVNQRGQTTYETGYTIDRWWMNNGTCVVGENGITVRPNNNDVGSTFLQYLDSIDINKVYTFAVADSNGNVYIIHSVPGQRVETNTSFGKIIAKCLPDVLPAFAVELPPGGTSATFVWAALYEGEYTAETLPPYVPKGYAAELAECQRYYLTKCGACMSGYALSNGQFTAFIPTPTRIRLDQPTLTVEVNDNAVWVGGMSRISSIAVKEVSFNGVQVAGLLENAPSQMQPIVFAATAIDVSADL